MTVPVQLLRGENTEHLPDRSRSQSQDSPDMRRMCGDERPFGLPDPGDTLSINQLNRLVNSFY
nr:MAG TPA: hypothetical protein [Caudoviricetes sp.]